MTKTSNAASRQLRIETLNRAQMTGIVHEWSELSDQLSGGPYTMPEMALAWFDHLSSAALHVVTARNGAGQLVGLAPLQRKTTAGVSRYQPLGTGVGVVAEILAAPSKANPAAAIWDELAGDLALEVNDLIYNGAGFEDLRWSDRWQTEAILNDVCPVIDLAEHESIDGFLNTPDKAGIRKKLAKARRNAASLNPEFVVHRKADVMEAWRGVGDLYDASEAANPRLHFGSGAYGEFFTNALRNLAEVDKVALHVLMLDSEPAAFDVYVLNGAHAYAILGRYNPVYGDYSPGQLLLAESIDWALTHGYRKIDLQLGGDLYKRRWSTSSYDTLRVLATPPGRLGKAKASMWALNSARELSTSLRNIRQ